MLRETRSPSARYARRNAIGCNLEAGGVTLAQILRNFFGFSVFFTYDFAFLNG